VSQLLPVPELIRRLRLHSKRRGHIKAIAAMGEVDYYHLRKIIREGKITERMQTLLSAVLQKLDDREVLVRQNMPSIANGENVNKMLIEERPPGAPLFQRRIVRANEYCRWARCIACGGTHFSPLRRTLSLKTSAITYYACDGCVDTPDRVMMGDRSSSTRSLQKP
jgi:hypothetical protein